MRSAMERGYSTTSASTPTSLSQQRDGAPAPCCPARLPRASHGSELPVFVLGMPRSGSTLVETIVDAHPEAHAVGEFSAMQEIVNDVTITIGSLAPYPDCVADLDQADVDKLAKI